MHTHFNLFCSLSGRLAAALMHGWTVAFLDIFSLFSRNLLYSALWILGFLSFHAVRERLSYLFYFSRDTCNPNLSTVPLFLYLPTVQSTLYAVFQLLSWNLRIPAVRISLYHPYSALYRIVFMLASWNHSSLAPCPTDVQPISSNSVGTFPAP